MPAIESSAKLTSKNQTTIPISVRKALDLGPEDQVTFIIENREVRVVKADNSPSDHVVAAYLTFLEQDMLINPSKLSVLQRDSQLAAALRKVELDPTWD